MEKKKEESIQKGQPILMHSISNHKKPKLLSQKSKSVSNPTIRNSNLQRTKDPKYKKRMSLIEIDYPQLINSKIAHLDIKEIKHKLEENKELN